MVDSSLFNPFENRLQIPVYWVPCIVFSGQVMGIVAMLSNYYINMDNLYRLSENTVRKREMDRLQHAKWACPVRYYNIVKCQFKSLTQFPDTVIDTIIMYLIMMNFPSIMGSMDDNTDKYNNDTSDAGHESVHSQSLEIDIEENANQVSLLLFKDEWYKARAYGLNKISKNTWKCMYAFCYLWIICRAILWSASLLILMYEYHLMIPSHSLWQNFILFLWILVYFQPHWLHFYCLAELIATLDGDEMEIPVVIQYNPYAYDDKCTLKQPLVASLIQSFAMFPFVWKLPNIVWCISFTVFTLASFIPIFLPVIICYTPFWTPYFAFVGILLRRMMERNNNSRLFLFVVTLALISMVYALWIIWSVIATTSVYCLSQQGKWLDCLVYGFKIQDTLVLPQSDDWRMIIVLLAMIF